MAVTIAIQMAKSVLSSQWRLFKTERFIKETKHFRDVDQFLLKLAEGIVSEERRIANPNSGAASGMDGVSYIAETENKEHALFFSVVREGTEAAEKKDIIFFKYNGKDEYASKNDSGLSSLLRLPAFNMVLNKSKAGAGTGDLQKLYRISHSECVNFPLLNEAQKKIVYIENQNVLVQGVAGSGKTNVCIDKVIFTACREYSGRVLYSTFSRGLLTDSQSKIKQFCNNLKAFISEYEAGRIVFSDGDHKKALENRLGIYFSVDDDDKILQKVKRITDFLNNKVDYLLIGDIYEQNGGKGESVGETYFIKNYVHGIKNHQLASKLRKVNHISYEVIFKEIYGVIAGSCDPSNPGRLITFEEYAEKRKDGYSRFECEVIYSLAKDYYAHLAANGLVDNNTVSRRLLEKNLGKKYSLAILDEVQDMTEVNLCLMKTLAIKLFCVGDALQMINPSYFSFAYLKRLLFEKDIVSVAELANNYRSTRRIADIAEKLGVINIGQFGTHSFVLKSASLDSDVPTSAIYVKDPNFLDALARERFSNYTVIVSGAKEKEALQKILKRQEILTVSEIKGLERDTVVMYNVLSSDIDKWKALERSSVNRKQADENSVYRYYFNLFYVGVSRAKMHLFVAENKEINLFAAFFKNNFENLGAENAVSSLIGTSSRMDADREELLERIEQFIKLEQFDNARFTADKLLTEAEKELHLSRIRIFETYVSHGKYRDAGIGFWELGDLDDAKKQFMLSGDDMLCELIDACNGGDEKALGIDILNFFPDVSGNEPARKLIAETVRKDLRQITEAQKSIKDRFKKLKEINNG